MRDVADFTRQVSEVDELRWVDIATLKADVQAHPDKYVASFADILRELEV